MTSLISKLRSAFSAELESITGANSIIKGYEEKMKAATKYIDLLKAAMSGIEFASGQEEIDFYRVDAVYFYGLYFQISKRYNLEIVRLTSSPDAYQQFLRAEIAEIDSFYKEYQFPIRYFFSEERYLDDVFFVRNSRLSALIQPGIILDNSLCCGSYLLAWSNAYREYRIFIEQILSGNTESQPGDIYEWNCTDADAAETIKAFFERKVINVNGHPANIKQLNDFFRLFLRRQINNVYDRIRINEKRKKDRNPFLKSLIEGGEGQTRGTNIKNNNKK